MCRIPTQNTKGPTEIVQDIIKTVVISYNDTRHTDTHFFETCSVNEINLCFGNTKLFGLNSAYLYVSVNFKQFLHENSRLKTAEIKFITNHPRLRRQRVVQTNRTNGLERKCRRRGHNRSIQKTLCCCCSYF